MESWYPGLRVIALVVLTAFPIGSSRSSPREATEPARPAADGAAQKTAAGGVDACSLLTAEEVGAAIGRRATPVTVTTGQAASCAYHDAANRADKLLELIVYTLTPDAARGTFEATKGGGRDQVAVPGIGDDAYWDKTFGLSVLKGRYEIGITVTASNVDRLKVARTLAPKLLSRLP
jgi:hypothetical protein